MNQRLPASTGDTSARAHAAVGPGEAPDLDKGALDEVTGGSGELLAELVAEYDAMAGPLFASLAEAVARADLREIGRIAHTFKGSSGMMGARGVMRLSEQIEQAARASDMAAVTAVFASFAECHEATLKAFHALRDAAV